MLELSSHEKIFEFLNSEFLKTKDEYSLQKPDKRLQLTKLKKVKKKIKKLLNDIDLMLTTRSFENNINIKIVNLKKEIENFFIRSQR